MALTQLLIFNANYSSLYNVLFASFIFSFFDSRYSSYAWFTIFMQTPSPQQPTLV